MIETHPYDDHMALAVFRHLDVHDHMEAEMIRGQSMSHLALFADWRSVEGVRLLSIIVSLDKAHGGTPFGVLGLSHTGQGGVAGAAFLSRSHLRFRRALAACAITLRARMPAFCADHGVRRIEVRSWARHPTAATFLELIGFRHEGDLPGFGPEGGETFRQYAWTQTPTQTPTQTQPPDTTNP